MGELSFIIFNEEEIASFVPNESNPSDCAAANLQKNDVVGAGDDLLSAPF